MAKRNHVGSLTVAAGALVAVALLVLVLVNPRTAGAAFRGTNGRIAFEANGISGISTINPNGTGLISPVPCSPPNHPFCSVSGVQDPSYSPDGNTIAYAANDGQDFEIYTIPATGGTPTKVTDNTTNDLDPTYSGPRGSSIIYSGFDGQDFEIFDIPATGGTRTQLTFNTARDGNPSFWSGAVRGRLIAYYSNADGDDEIYMIPWTAGATPVQLTNNNTTDRFPDWEFDGRRIVYTCFDAAPGGGSDFEVCTIRRPTGFIHNPVQLTHNFTNEFEPVFSPDDRRIAYSSFDGQNFQIFTIDRAGGTLTRVTSGGGANPSWQPIP